MPYRAGILVLSDSVSAGTAQDRSGALIRETLVRHDLEIAAFAVMPDDEDAIVEKLLHWCDAEKIDLIVTTGGTGLGPRDRTPEAFARVLERALPGVEEAMRAYGQQRNPRAMLSRSRAGQRGMTILVALPGSAKAVEECLEVLFPPLLHAFPIMKGEGHAPAA